MMKYKVIIDATEYTDVDIRSGNIERPLFDKFGIGNVCEAQLRIVFRQTTSIPAMAKIIPYALINEAWEPLGTFYLDERSKDSVGLMSIVAYDSMLKANKVWIPDQSLQFPMPMSEAVNIIANLMGISVDPRTQISSTYTIDYPANDYTLRDVLGFIAVANGGNWTITREDKFLFIPLVLESDTVHQIGEKALSFTQYQKSHPVSGVVLWADDNNSYKAGNDTGTVIEADCPYATQEIADAVYSAIQGYEYQGLKADGAKVTPIAELGDGITVHGVSTVLAYQNIRFSTGEVMDVAAPGSDETLHEYKTDGETTKKFNRQISQTRSEITKTAEEINLKIEATDGRVSDVKQTVDGITLSVTSSSSTDGQTTAKITLKVGPNSYTGHIKLDGNVNVSGQLSADALYAALGDIADLTVDRLSTSRRIVKYLAGDQSDDNYIRIHDQYIEFVSGVYASGTEQASNPHGALLYWEANPEGASIGSDGYPYVNGERIFTTTTETNWPVMVYKYTELVKRSIAFEQQANQYVPVDVFGAGDPGGRQKGRLIKGTDGLQLTYDTSAGKTLGIRMRDDGYTDLYGLRRTTGLNFSEWDNGKFYEIIDGDDTRHANNVEFDSQDRPIKITNDSGHVITITW